MLSRKSQTIICSLFLLILVPVAATPQAPPPGVSTGQKIGTIIKDAITTVAPGVSSILDLIWSHLSKPSDTTAKKTDLQQAAQVSDTQAKQQAVAAAQKQLQPVSNVSDELSVIGRFLGPSVLATQDLIVMKTKAAEGTIDWVSIGNNWDLATKQIANLKSVPDSDLTKVRDAYLRDRLTKIRNANDTTVVSITQEVSQKNLADLRADLLTLLSTLADMTAVAGYEFAELQADISDLAAWAKGTGAGAPAIPKWDTYKKFLDTNVRTVSR